MEKETVKNLAHQIMFDLTDEEVLDVMHELESVKQYSQMLDAIDTEGVEEMVYPFEMETTFLREDTVNHVITQAEALSNVKEVRAGHVLVPKVVK